MDEQLTTSLSEAVSHPSLRARQALWVTQSVFFLALAVCLVICHGHVANTDGISYYGVYAPTMPVIFVGYLTAAGGLWWTSSVLVEGGAPVALRPALRALAIGLVVLLVTPFDQGTFLNWAHMVTGVTMAVIQVLLALGVLWRRPSLASVGAFLVLIVGGVVGAISLPDSHASLLLSGEILLEVGFAWSLIEWTYAVGSRSR